MKIILFYHSLLSDWNHGNAHFLRGYATELLKRNHDVEIYEPKNCWSYSNLLKDNGEKYILPFYEHYPFLSSNAYKEEELNLENILCSADLVIVHEWNTYSLVKKIGEYKKLKGNFTLLFHDTHHRAVTEYSNMSKYDLTGFDGVLAFGNILKDIYIKNGLAKKAFTWHEAADTNIFKPIKNERIGDVVWIGNWGDGERSDEINEYLIEPINKLKLKAAVYGVMYPEEAIKKLNKAGIEYKGYLPNYLVPEVFSKYKFTIHIPRNPYIEKLKGIPTIRPFEALACGIPLISRYWPDSENLFKGDEFLSVNSGKDMEDKIVALLNNEDLQQKLISAGLNVIRNKHNCSNRVSELLGIYDSINSKKESFKI